VPYSRGRPDDSKSFEQIASALVLLDKFAPKIGQFRRVDVQILEVAGNGAANGSDRPLPPVPLPVSQGFGRRDSALERRPGRPAVFASGKTVAVGRLGSVDPDRDDRDAALRKLQREIEQCRLRAA
jgi:hypothetical protein